MYGGYSNSVYTCTTVSTMMGLNVVFKNADPIQGYKG